ncbi:MAG TPA: hypothetical protein V6C65_41985, partial [Allocoleopsis sp.]
GQNLSTTQTQQWVAQQKSQYVQQPSKEITRDKYVDRLLSTVQKLDLKSTKAPLEQLQELQATLESTLEAVKHLLK